MLSNLLRFGAQTHLMAAIKMACHQINFFTAQL